MRQAGRIRKVFAGGMRQAGYIAAGGIYALDHHIDRLEEDHRRARAIGDVLAGMSCVESISPIETNLIYFKLNAGMPAATFLEKLKAHDIHAFALSDQTIRFVTHLDFTEEMLTKCGEVLRNI